MTGPGRLPYPLGRHVEHDPRSRRFSFEAATALPNYSVTHPRRTPIFDQGNLGSCTGMAMAGWLGTDPAGDSTASYSLAVELYSEATRLDIWDGEWPPDDTGSSGNAVAKAARNRGLISGWQHAFTFDVVLAAVVTAPIIVGVPWHEPMFYPLESGYLDCGGDVVGGHEVLIRGIDPRKRHVLADNSWGTSWGRDGRFWLRFDDLERLLADDGDATMMQR